MEKRIKPLTGEKVSTPDGEGYVVELLSYDDVALGEDKDQDWLKYVRSRIGKTFRKNYYKAVVEFEGKRPQSTYECWEIDFDANKDAEDAPWRS